MGETKSPIQGQVALERGEAGLNVLCARRCTRSFLDIISLLIGYFYEFIITDEKTRTHRILLVLTMPCNCEYLVPCLSVQRVLFFEGNFCSCLTPSLQILVITPSSYSRKKNFFFFSHPYPFQYVLVSNQLCWNSNQHFPPFFKNKEPKIIYPFHMVGMSTFLSNHVSLTLPSASW